jgi:hypothetical protein
MLKTVTLLTAALAIASAAHAEDRVYRASVTVKLAGKSDKEIARALRAAAGEACRAASAQAGVVATISDVECEANAIRDARAVIKAAQAAPPSRVASAN